MKEEDQFLCVCLAFILFMLTMMKIHDSYEGSKVFRWNHNERKL